MAKKNTSDYSSTQKPKKNILGQKPTAKKTEEKKFAFESDSRPRLNSPKKEKNSQPLIDMRMGELSIERLAHDGRGIAHWQAPEEHRDAAQHHGKIVFVKQGLVGEKIHARLVKEHPRFIEARVESIIESSPHRCAPVCAVFGECGGCQLQHMPEALQLEYKQQALLDQLGKQLIPKKILPVITSPQFNYRRAARLSVDYSNGFSFGFREENSRKVVDLSACPVLTETLNGLIDPLKKLLVLFSEAQSISHVELIDAEPRAVIIFRVLKNIPDDLMKKMVDLKDSRAVDIYCQLNESNQLTDLAGNEVSPCLSYELHDFKLRMNFHPRDFIQVNAAVNQKMVSQAIHLLKLKSDERVLDLFCGIGNFTLPLALHAKEVIGLEAEASMVVQGRDNAAAMNLNNVSFVASDLTKVSEHRLQQLCGKVDAVLLDPPRDGAKEVLEKISSLSAKRILYVSCNPATLARDAKILSAAGYQLHSLGVMDMFPQTAHLESMALFQKK